MADTMRLDNLLSKTVCTTRSEAKAMLRRGAVRVNGTVQKKGDARVTPGVDNIVAAGQPVNYQSHITIVMNKPEEVLCAARDKSAKTVVDLLPPALVHRGCLPAGRLDKNTPGLLILTTNGDLTHQLISPATKVPRVYRAVVTGRLTGEDVHAFLQGLHIVDSDGSFDALPALLYIESAGEQQSTARVLVRQGKYHQVKRMFAARGHRVLALHRLAIGKLWLPGDLAPGEWREITIEEPQLLKEDNEQLI